MKSFMQKISQSRIVQLLLKTVEKWQQDQCGEKAAALAYFTFFSIFPFILVVLSCLSLLVAPDTSTFGEIVSYAEQVLPNEAYGIFENTLIEFSRDRQTVGILGLFILFLSGSRFLDSLDRTFDTIWCVQRQSPITPGWILAIVNFIYRKLLAVGLVILLVIFLYLAPLLEIAIGISIGIVDNFGHRIDFFFIDRITSLITAESIVSFILLFVLLATTFKVLPSTRVEWGDVWLGGAITAALFKLLQYLTSSGIISLSRNFQSYGVVGSVMAIVFWLYLTSQLLFLGAEFTYFYAQLYGSRRLKPKNRPVT